MSQKSTIPKLEFSTFRDFVRIVYKRGNIEESNAAVILVIGLLLQYHFAVLFLKNVGLENSRAIV